MAWEPEKIKERQNSIILQEAGIRLSDLDILRSDHLDHLRDLGLITIEDLYFTTSEETWESTIIPFEPIGTIKKIINLPITTTIEELGEEIVTILQENEITSILDLILTGDPILEQRTGLPAERFENLKFALDFGALIEAFDKSVLFTPDVLFKDANLLHKKGYTRIIDVVLEKPQKIGKLLGMKNSEAQHLIKNITRSAILKTEDDRGVQLRELNAFTRQDLRSIARSGFFEMNPLDTLQEVVFQLSEDTFQGEQYLLKQVLNLQQVIKIKLADIRELDKLMVDKLAKHDILTIGEALMIGYDDLLNDLDAVEALRRISLVISDIRPFLASAVLPIQSVMHTNNSYTPLSNVWLNADEIDFTKLHIRTVNNLVSVLSIPVKLTHLVTEFTGNYEDIENKTIGDIALEYTPDETSDLALIKAELSQTGSLIKILKQGSTPISLLDIPPFAYRALKAHSIRTVEKIIQQSPKYLAEITKSTQKYWNNIIEIFDPEVFEARMGDIGIPLSQIPVTGDEKEQLASQELLYLDEIAVFENPKGIISTLQQFMNAPTIYLAGTPGEREIAENNDAHSVIESVLVLRNQGAPQELIVEMITIAWTAYSKNSIPIQQKVAEGRIKTMQELVGSKYDFEPSRNLTALIKKFSTSLLLLKIPAKDLQEAVHMHRCSSILDALTNPMIFGSIENIREDLQSKEDLDNYINSDIALPLDLLKALSAANFNRVKDSGLTVQDLLSAPRTLEEFKGIKKRTLNEIRDLLRIPLSRLVIENIQVFEGTKIQLKYVRLDKLIQDLNDLSERSPESCEKIISILTSEKLRVIREKEIPSEVQTAAETALGQSTPGLYELWTATWQSANLLQKIDTAPAKTIKNYVHDLSKSVAVIPGIKPLELWNLCKRNIITLASFILSTPDKLVQLSGLTKKRVIELQKIALNAPALTEDHAKYGLRTIGDKLGFDKFDLSDITLYQLSDPNSHPLLQSIKVPKELQTLLDSKIILTEIGAHLNLNETKTLLSTGISTIIDLILYPEIKGKLPKSLENLDSRIKIIKQSIGKSLAKDIQLSKLALEKSLYEGRAKTLTELVHFAVNNTDANLNRRLFVNLSYLGLPQKIEGDLRKAKIETFYDIAIMHPGKLSELISPDFKDNLAFFESIDLENIVSKLED
ncbi:MAG: hypothetical protein IH840_14135, partial [Candidatus Heimdallarchaeota archaeon]|nr:hypothetical protein [Candidatus Heimdallarchaeota archaeon]